MAHHHRRHCYYILHNSNDLSSFAGKIFHLCTTLLTANKSFSRDIMMVFTLHTTFLWTHACSFHFEIESECSRFVKYLVCTSVRTVVCVRPVQYKCVCTSTRYLRYYCTVTRTRELRYCFSTYTKCPKRSLLMFLLMQLRIRRAFFCPSRRKQKVGGGALLGVLHADSPSHGKKVVYCSTNCVSIGAIRIVRIELIEPLAHL